MKSLVYSARIRTQEELRLRIIEAGATIKNNSDAIRHIGLPGFAKLNSPFNKMATVNNCCE